MVNATIALQWGYIGKSGLNLTLGGCIIKINGS